MDFSSLHEERRRWIKLTGALEGFEVEIRYRGMKERERFEAKMTADGVLRKEGGVATGKFAQLVASYCKEGITDWKVPERFRDDKDTNPPYVGAELAKILDASRESLDRITDAMTEEAAFFSQSESNGTG